MNLVTSPDKEKPDEPVEHKGIVVATSMGVKQGPGAASSADSGSSAGRAPRGGRSSDLTDSCAAMLDRGFSRNSGGTTMNRTSRGRSRSPETNPAPDTNRQRVPPARHLIPQPAQLLRGRVDGGPTTLGSDAHAGRA